MLYDHTDEPLNMQAAALTFAMMLFEQEAAHPLGGEREPGEVPGVDSFGFLPSWVPVPRAGVVPFLAQLPCPALVFQSTHRGTVSLMLLDELGGERRAWAQKTLDNHCAGIEELASQFYPALYGESKILLEIRDESHIITLDALRFWARRFGCPTGWNMGGPREGAPDGVAAQIRLFSPDGRVSPPTESVAPWQRPAW